MALSATAAARKDKNAGYAPMQHRHYATIAAIIAKFRKEVSHADAEVMADHFAGELVDTNANFDRKRFIAACMED